MVEQPLAGEWWYVSDPCHPTGAGPAVSRVHLEVGRSFGAGPLDLLLTVILPSVSLAASARLRAFRRGLLPWRR
jgi:hypothetical protein